MLLNLWICCSSLTLFAGCSSLALLAGCFSLPGFAAPLSQCWQAVGAGASRRWQGGESPPDCTKLLRPVDPSVLYPKPLTAYPPLDPRFDWTSIRVTRIHAKDVLQFCALFELKSAPSSLIRCIALTPSPPMERSNLNLKSQCVFDSKTYHDHVEEIIKYSMAFSFQIMSEDAGASLSLQLSQVVQ